MPKNWIIFISLLTTFLFLGKKQGDERLSNLKGKAAYQVLQELQKEDSSFNFINIRELNLSYYNITSLPESFGKLKNLEKLTLNHNKLTSLPKSFGNL
ncbi:MAG: leucine-rich repeat domain-containing protein, partial [Spirochaetota bacterium]